MTVDVPSGRLACVARCDVDARRVTSVRFTNVPSFVLATGVTLPTTRGPVTVDVAYGGAFYGSADVRSLGLAVDTASLPALIDLQRRAAPGARRRARRRPPGRARAARHLRHHLVAGRAHGPGRRRRADPAQRHRLRRRRGRPLAVRVRHVGPAGAAPRGGQPPDRGDAPPSEHRRLGLRRPRHGGGARRRAAARSSPRSRERPISPAAAASSSTRPTRWARASSCADGQRTTTRWAWRPDLDSPVPGRGVG